MGRVLIVAAMVATSLSVAAPHVGAAPTSGVHFATSTRLLDLVNVAAGIKGTVLPTPQDATRAIVQVTVGEAAGGTSGQLMVNSCSVFANPKTDIVLPLLAGTSVQTAQVLVPITNSGVCVTTTVGVSRLTLDFQGWVDSNGGSAYVDVPFSFVTTVVGPVTAEPIDLATLGVPADAAGVAVWLDALSATPGFATLFPCGQVPPLSSQAFWNAAEPATELIAAVATSVDGLCITISDGASVDVSIDGYYRAGAAPTFTSPPQVRYTKQRAPGFVGVSPTRLFDTRTGGLPINGGQVYRLDIGPYVPVDTTAVVMNVTATEATGEGFVTAYPCDGTQPDTSSLNFVASQTVPNLVTVDAAFDTDICFFASATTHLLADLSGYYVTGAGDGFTPSAPKRVFDTRRTGHKPPNSIFEFDFSFFVPANASSVVFNLTATEVGGPGYVTAFPCGDAPPLASNLNVSIGQTVPNLVTVALPSNKHVCFFKVPSANLIADLAGWYSPSAKSGFVAIQPTRWADTRGVPVVPLAAGSVFSIPFADDFPDATAVVFNATATETQGAGYLTLYPCAGAPPNASNVNFVPGQSIPNMGISAVDANGDLCIFNSAPSNWIVDVSGYFTESSEFVPYFPDGTDNQ